MSLEPVDVAELVALGVEAYTDGHGMRGRLLTSAQLRARSRGEVTKPETLNYRTKKPERDGLFCARIFGPIEDFCCICTKYRGEQHRGVKCEKCGVEVLPASVRRERFGHIQLAVPVVHPLQKAGVARLLQISAQALDEVIGGSAQLDGPGTITREQDANEIGGRAIQAALARVDLRVMADDPELAPLAEYLTPDQLTVDVLAVLPPDLRPLVPLEDGRFATSDLNDLYRRVVNRNNRVRRLIELNAPMIILHNESRMLQESVDALICNEQLAKPIVHRKRTLRSLVTQALERLAEQPGAPASIDALLGRGAADTPEPRAVLELADASQTEDDDYDF